MCLCLSRNVPDNQSPAPSPGPRAPPSPSGSSVTATSSTLVSTSPTLASNPLPLISTPTRTRDLPEPYTDVLCSDVPGDSGMRAQTIGLMTPPASESRRARSVPANTVRSSTPSTTSANLRPMEPLHIVAEEEDQKPTLPIVSASVRVTRAQAAAASPGTSVSSVRSTSTQATGGSTTRKTAGGGSAKKVRSYNSLYHHV